MSAQVSVVILTFNEEVNVGRALESVVGWSDDIHIVDSYSTDRTLEIAKEKGAHVFQNPWENWAVQRNWALDNLPLKYEWVLFLDADEWITRELKEEITRKLPQIRPEYTAMLIRIKNHFLGKWLRYGGQYFWHFRLVRKGKAQWIPYGASEYGSTNGKVDKLYTHIMHDNRKGITFFVEKHNRLADMLAQQELRGNDPAYEASQKGLFVEGARQVSKRQRIWNRMPLFARPFMHFCYRYIYKLAVLDGLPGLLYCLFHDFWYYLLVDIKIYELKRRGGKDL